MASIVQGAPHVAGTLVVLVVASVLMLVASQLLGGRDAPSEGTLGSNQAGDADDDGFLSGIPVIGSIIDLADGDDAAAPTSEPTPASSANPTAAATAAAQAADAGSVNPAATPAPPPFPPGFPAPFIPAEEPFQPVPPLAPAPTPPPSAPGPTPAPTPTPEPPTPAPTPEPEPTPSTDGTCSNGVDDDGDALIDLVDPGCLLLGNSEFDG